jgi:hypothetical protein
LQRDAYTCRGCGKIGEEAGGSVELHVHHADPDPDDRDRHALSNLTTYCKECHLWQHLKSESDDVPFEITPAVDKKLDPVDYEILRYLWEHGPATTSEVVDALTPPLTSTAVRERLAALMGLDNVVADCDRQLVDQDVNTGVWGLPEQIEQSKRGDIPSDNQTFIQRIEEEQVRKAVERGYDQDTIADVLDISPRTVVHKEKRAWAYGFPLDAFRRGGDGGQHPAGNTASDAGDEAGEGNEAGEAVEQPSGGDGDDEQQAVAGDETTAGDEQGGADAAGDAGHSRGDTGGEASGAGDADVIAVREQLQTAIAALQQINAEL